MQMGVLILSWMIFAVHLFFFVQM